MYLVVTYANRHFVTGRNRLESSCRKLGQSIVCYGDNNDFARHDDFPYYFKVDALLTAARQAEILLWADSSVFATGKGCLTPIFDHIKREGYWLQNNGSTNAMWCNDTSLAAFGFNRDEADKQCQIDAACYGVAPGHSTGKIILDELVRHKDLFRGARDNLRRSESLDIRCLGHRHDQSVLSLIAAKHRLNTPWPDAHMWYQWGLNPEYLLNLDHQ